MKRVQESMSSPVAAFSEETCLVVAVEAMRTRHVRHLCVVRQTRVVGIVSDRDVKRALPSALAGAVRMDYEAILEETPLSRVMSRAPVCIASQAPLARAVSLMLEHRISALPVVDDGVLVGMLTETDCLRALGGLLDDDAEPRSVA